MSFLIGVAAQILEWILMLGGKALYDWTTELVRKNNEKKREKENLDNLHEAEKKGDKDAILEKERDIFNG